MALQNPIKMKFYTETALIYILKKSTHAPYKANLECA